MVDEKGGVLALQCCSEGLVGLRNRLLQALKVLCKIAAVFRRALGESLQHVARHDVGVSAAHPRVGIADAVAMCYQFDAIGGVDKRCLGSVLLQSFCPGAFESNFTYHEKEPALAERHHLLCSGFIGFGIAVLRHHRGHLKAVAGDFFGKIA